jgi:hypothetical protein
VASIVAAVVVVAAADGALAPEQVDVVLQREEVQSSAGQDVRLVLSVDRISGVL